jgi:hypothetical protein
MFMHIVTQLSGRVTALYTQVLGWLKALLCKLVSNLRVNFFRASQSVVNRFNLLNPLRVQTVLSFNRFRVSLTTAVQLIKVGLITAKAKLIQTGQQLVTIAHQTLQHVKALFKKGS